MHVVSKLKPTHMKLTTVFCNKITPPPTDSCQKFSMLSYEDIILATPVIHNAQIGRKVRLNLT